MLVFINYFFSVLRFVTYVVAVAVYNESNVRWKERYVTYLKHYPETLLDRLRYITQKTGPVSG